MSVLMTNIDSKAHYKIMEDPIMPAIVEFPTVVKKALEEFFGGREFKVSGGLLKKPVCHVSDGPITRSCSTNAGICHWYIQIPRFFNSPSGTIFR